VYVAAPGFVAARAEKGSWFWTARACPLIEQALWTVGY
jgi:hypothetical protein